MNQIFQWAKPIVIGLASLFFLLLGIDTLVSGYRSTNPHLFIVYFFGSNLMILISAVGVLYAIIKIYSRLTGKADQRPEDTRTR